MKTIGQLLKEPSIVGEPIPMPWPNLDRELNLHTKELAIVAGAPGAGKSIYALNVAMSMNEPVLYMAMDSAPSVTARSIALALNADIAWVYEAMRDEDTITQLQKDLKDSNPNLFISTGAETVGGIQDRVVALTEVMGKAPKLIILDNLIDRYVDGHVHTDTGFYAAALNPLKQMAIEHDTCVMALHHVTRRGGDKGENPHGLGTRALRMTDLLYSGERESEHVLGVYHDVAKEKMFIQILKQRDGNADPEGGVRVPLKWEATKGKLEKTWGYK